VSDLKSPSAPTPPSSPAPEGAAAPAARATSNVYAEIALVGLRIIEKLLTRSGSKYLREWTETKQALSDEWAKYPEINSERIRKYEDRLKNIAEMVEYEIENPPK
jgi:hypothetical protein